MRYAELMSLLSIFKGIVHPYELKKAREMRNASLAFGFLTRNSSLGELSILHI